VCAVRPEIFAAALRAGVEPATSRSLSIKLHLRDGQQRDASICPLCLSAASILWGDEPRCFIEFFELGVVGAKIWDQPINTRTLVS